MCGASASLDKLCTGLYGITGSSPRWAVLHVAATNGALAPRAAYGLWDVAQQVQEWVLVLTKGAGWTKGPCRVDGDVDRWRHTGGTR